MSTKLIENRKNGGKLEKLTSQQQTFVCELLADKNFNVTEAARKAGYKHPTQAGYKLLNLPRIKAILGKAQREREERTQLKSDDIWEYLHRVLTFDPAEVFESAGRGWWLIKKLEDIPLKYRQLVESIQMRTTQVRQKVKDGDKEKIKTVDMPCPMVKFVSKAQALEIAARHAIPQQHEHTVVTLDWSNLIGGVNGNGRPDLIEAEIKAIEAKEV